MGLLFATILASLVILVVSYRRKNTTWESLLHPRVGPLAYLIYALLLPPAYMAVTGNGIGSISHDTLTPMTTLVMCLTVLSFLVGTYLHNLFRQPRQEDSGHLGRTARPPVLGNDNPRTLVQFGRLLLVLSILAKIYQVRAGGSVFSSAYGADQTSFDATSSIGVFGESLVGVGSLAIMYGNSRDSRGPLRGWDFLLIGGVLSISLLLLGSRGEALAPIILYVWFRARMGRKIRRALLVVGAVGLTGVLMLVWQVRSVTSAAGDYPLAQQILWQTSSPQLLTANVTSLVPSTVGFYNGGTYLSALKYFAPGPISRALFGAPTGTGAGAYRDLIQFSDPNQGFGFALPTEAYLNFGLVGVVVVGVLLGLLFQATFTWAVDSSLTFRVSSFVYPLLVSYLPYGLRTDALGQIKSIVYPILIVAIGLLLARSVSVATKSHNHAKDVAGRDLIPSRR